MATEANNSDRQSYALPEKSSIIHQIIRFKRPVNYYFHTAEVLVMEVNQAFVVEMRSGMTYSHYSSNVAERYGDWKARWDFDNLLEARVFVTKIIGNPQEYGQLNLPPNWTSIWNDHQSRTANKNSAVAPVVITYNYERPQGVEDGSLATGIADGSGSWIFGQATSKNASSTVLTTTEAQNLPYGIATGEIVRQLWGRSELAARVAMLDFLQRIPFTYGHWTHWKWLYKQAEAHDDFEMLAVAIARLDRQPLIDNANQATAFSNTAPSLNTIMYMKRRARRFLHQLAKRNPEQYVQLANSILLDSGKGRTSLDLKTQWISIDILYGTSKRYIQTAHDRGGYVLRQKWPNFARADERVPEAWSRQLELIQKLYQAEVAWQISEWAITMLKRRKEPVPPITDEQASRFLAAGFDSPLLTKIAVAHIAAKVEGGRLSGAKDIARAFFLADGATRRRLRALLGAFNKPSEWMAKFSGQLFEELARSLNIQNHISHRQMDAGILLISHYRSFLNKEQHLTLLPVLLATRNSELLPIVKEISAFVTDNRLLEILMRFSKLGAIPREELAKLLVEEYNLKKRYLHSYHVWSLISYYGNEWIREVGWRLLEATAVNNPNLISEVWQYINQYGGYSKTILEYIFKSPTALRLLSEKPEILADLLKKLLDNYPSLLAELPKEAFDRFFRSYSLDVIVDVVTRLDDFNWSKLRDRLMKFLEEDARLASFWKTVLGAIPNDTTSKLAARFLQDPTMVNLFATVADSSFLKFSDPAIEPLLLNWLLSQPEKHAQDTEILLMAAINKLKRMRQWALQRIAQMNLTMPFALRLLESGLPETMAVGRNFFEALPENDAQELEYVLAVCDSPDLATQRYGRDLLKRRQAHLPIAEVTRRLAEHPDPLLQEVVAAQLLETPQLVDSAEFDRVVLRTRNKGRRVKEMVKKRVAEHAAGANAETLPDKAVLLEMARSRTPRDAEWALEQLVKMALNGETVEGLEILGEAGI